MIKRLLIANRGEIAVRILRTCKALGIETVLAVSTADRDALPCRLADRVLCIGGPAPASSYLDRNALITAAVKSGCDALHPGYGFLAENPALAELASDAGVTFVGPSAQHLRLFGDKVAARHAAQQAGLQVSAGSDSVRGGADEAIAVAERIGFPVMLKPVGGGGGKGMRLVTDRGALAAEMAAAGNEAAAAFGASEVYLERWIPSARHVEVQVAGDGEGAIHFGDRDCSVQRRRQKLIEEAPAPGLDPGLQASLREAAVELCRSVGYDSVGTVEFLVDTANAEFYFLEVNPRIQVEHGITEMIADVDLVALQIHLASGAPLELAQRDIELRGAAIECRINAEAPDAGFRPSPGTITVWDPPTSPALRIDTHCYPGYLVPPYYDSLIAKVMARGGDRTAAIAEMAAALDAFAISGIETTRRLLAAVVEHPAFQQGDISTTWLDDELSAGRLLVDDARSAVLAAGGTAQATARPGNVA